MKKGIVLCFVLMVVCSVHLAGETIIELDGGAKDQQKAENEALFSDEPFVTSTNSAETAMITETISDFLADAANYVRSLPDDEKEKIDFQEEEETENPKKEKQSKGIWKAMEISREIFSNWINFSKKPNLRHIYYHGIHGVAEEDESYYEKDSSICSNLFQFSRLVIRTAAWQVL